MGWWTINIPAQRAPQDSRKGGLPTCVLKPRAEIEAYVPQRLATANHLSASLNVLDTMTKQLTGDKHKTD